ncbi:MAG: glycosyltransferase [Planctomycetota bacterium]
MRPIRVMHILSDFHFGGAQQAVFEIVSNLDRSRFTPHVCCLRRGGALVARLDDRRIPFHLVLFSSRFSPGGLWRLRGLLRELNIDIVHTHLRRANLSGRLAGIFAGTPVIIAHAHDLLPVKRRLHRWVNRWLSKRTTHFLCVSNAVADAQAQENGFDRSRFTTFYNFLNPEEYRVVRSPMLAKGDLGLPMGSPCVGIVGRLHPVKGHDLFLEAAFLLNQRRPDVHFVVAGDGPLKAALRDKVRSLGMGHKVTFVGFRHEIAQVYRALDCLVLTSRSEGFGKALIEAQAAGVPVVARAVGGVPEALAGGGGLLVEEATPQAVARSIEEALKPQTARMLRAQIPSNLARFDAARQMTVLEDFYEAAFQAKQAAEAPEE